MNRANPSVIESKLETTTTVSTSPLLDKRDPVYALETIIFVNILSLKKHKL